MNLATQEAINKITEIFSSLNDEDRSVALHYFMGWTRSETEGVKHYEKPMERLAFLLSGQACSEARQFIEEIEKENLELRNKLKLNNNNEDQL